MPQTTTFPLRFGLQLPAPENIKSVEVFSEGGLDLTQSILETRPGCASTLINFEASLTGGYKRILGYQKYSATIVPGQGSILGVAVAWPDQILAARQDASDATKYNVYKSSGLGWTQLNPSTTTQSCTTTNTNTTLQVTSTTGLVRGQPISGTDIPVGTYIISITDGTHLVMSQAATGSATNTLTFSNPLAYSSGMFITSCYYDWAGPVVTAMFDGVNFAYRWDATNGFTMMVGTAAAPAPTNPQCGCEFMGYLVVGGFSSNPGAIAWCAPNNDNDWASVDGSVIAVVSDVVRYLKVWRNNLIIFCNKAIDKMIPNSLNTTGISPPPAFQILPITDRIGCISGRTVRECNGDLLFLAPDGIRTISGTFNIGDTEIASISRPIQSIVSAISISTTTSMAVVVHKKTQYRLFYPNYSTPIGGNLGVIASVRRFRDGHEGWEFGQLAGFQPTCIDSGYQSNGQEYIVHGGTDGYVYRQEQGNNLNGALINEQYVTVPLELGDYGIRKAVKRVTLYVSTEGGSASSLGLSLIYDYKNPGIIQPQVYILNNVGNAAPQYDSGVEYDTGAVYGPIAVTNVRQLVQGSGFVLQLQLNFVGNTNSDPYIIQGYYIEFFPAGRR